MFRRPAAEDEVAGWVRRARSSQRDLYGCAKLHRCEVSRVWPGAAMVSIIRLSNSVKSEEIR